MDAEYIGELFRELGEVRVRRLFGGAGLYADGVMFALVFDDVIYLKADTATMPDFARENSAPFQYDTKSGRRALATYWRVPERLYDDADELALWARRAVAVARQTAARKPARIETVKKRKKRR